MAIHSKQGDKSGEGPRREFEIEYYTKELGRPLQRMMLERQLASLGGTTQAAHREEQPGDAESPPRDDRAG